MIKNRMLTLGEVMEELKKEFLENGELTDDDWSLYTEGDTVLRGDTVCCVADCTEIADDDEEIFPDYAIENGMDTYVSGELINDVADSFLSMKRSAETDELITAFEHYLENDSFVIPEGAADPYRKPRVVLICKPEDKRVLMKMKKAFEIGTPLSEFISSAENVPFILSEATNFAEAKRIIDENGFGEWISVEF